MESKAKFHKGPDKHRNRKDKPLKPRRKCRTCGRDPWPNYFYCGSCLPRISALDRGLPVHNVTLKRTN